MRRRSWWRAGLRCGGLIHDPHQPAAASRDPAQTAAAAVLHHRWASWSPSAPASGSSCTPISTTSSTTQQSRNKYLQDEIVKLDKQIAEIQKLKDQTAALLARKRVVETLQGNRSEVVHLLDQLVRQLPDGVYLKGIKQTGTEVTITGFTQSQARVSTLMRNLESSPNWRTPD